MRGGAEPREMACSGQIVAATRSVKGEFWVAEKLQETACLAAILWIFPVEKFSLR
jgi:hypothetical protein